MVRRIPVTACLLLLCVAAARAVPLVDASTPIPEDVVLLNFRGSGLDWVYAGAFQPGITLQDATVYGPEYRAAEGWRFATEEEWRERPQWTDFIRAGFSPTDVLGSANASNYRFASAYWSQLDHVDVFEAADGFVFSDHADHPWRLTGETWYVRQTQPAPVPDGASTGLLILLVAALGAVAQPLRSLVHGRRRQR